MKTPNSGRKKGTPNKASTAIWRRIEREADPIGFLRRIQDGEPVERSLDKDGKTEPVKFWPSLDQSIRAAVELAKFLPPGPRMRPISLQLPPVKTAADVLAATGTVVDAMATGAITPDEAATIAGVLDARRKAFETVELENRVAQLEQQAKGPATK